MALFLDSAIMDDVRSAMQLGFVTGVTTNPSLIAKAGRPGLMVLRDILDATHGPVFYQVTADAVEERMSQARKAAEFNPQRVIVKIPATTENIAMAYRLTKEGIVCCVTAVSSSAQAYLSAQAGAAYAVPYVNRLTRQLGDGIAVLRDCKAVVAGTSTKILAASLKSPEEVVAAVIAGADDITIPLDVIMKLGDHPLSQKAIEDFAADYAKVK
ncbi:MAG TPA: transaldolase family protein [Longilinea sp.]|nr:transaldolase family protein [Longilinea sp.]